MGFDRDYVEFENGEISRIRCMNCGETVAMVDEVPSDKFPGKTLRQMRKLSNWRQKRIELNNGTYMEPIFCAECINKDVEDEKMMRLVKRAWKSEMEALGRPESDIKNHDDKVKNLMMTRKNNKSPGKDK